MRAAIYCRLSKEDGGSIESESIVNQKNMLTDFAKNKNWKIFDYYCDDDYSGANIERPEFLRLLSDAKEKKFEIVLCKSQSRFSRDISVIEEYVHTKFPLWGIRFVSVIDNADTAVSHNKKARQINSLINEWFLEDLSENVRAVFKTKMKRGEYLAAFAPFGYKKDENIKNHLLPDPESADVVRFIFTQRKLGGGVLEIARILNDRGVPTPSAYRKKNNPNLKVKVSKFWTTKMISGILNNPVYFGHTVQNVTNRVNFKSSKRIKNPQSEWIIRENTHESLSAGREYVLPKTRPSYKKGSSFLQAKVICGICGERLVRVNTKTTAQKTITYLRCKKKYAFSDSGCHCPSIRADDLEDEALLEGEKIIFSHISKEELFMLFKPSTTNFEGKKDIKKEIEVLEKALEEIYLDKVSGVISKEQFERFKESFEEKKAELLGSANFFSKKECDDDKLEVLYNDFLKVFISSALKQIVISQNEDGNPVAEFFWEGA